MRFSAITGRLQGLGSEKWAVHIEGKRRQAGGDDLIILSIGEPDFHRGHTRRHERRRMRAGRTRYSNGRGEPEVLEAICGLLHQALRPCGRAEPSAVSCRARNPHSLPRWRPSSRKAATSLCPIPITRLMRA